MSERNHSPAGEGSAAPKDKSAAKNESEGILQALYKVKREIAAVGTALVVGGVAAYGYKELNDSDKPGASESKHKGDAKAFRLPDDISQTYFDQNPDYFKKFTVNGNFTPEEREKRTVRLRNGSVLFKDVGMSFYQVQAGDTLSSIRAELSQLPEYAFLKDQRVKTESFNIPARELQAGMWLPIPIENEDRHVTDEQFTVYASKAIDDMRSDPHYGSYVREVLSIISERELLATMIAVAKQESGGVPIGQLELHRWEPPYNSFSFSIFHILMEKDRSGMPGPGLAARRKLNFSEGQVYHPYNAVKLFFGYLKEKRAKPANYFPITKYAKSFASLYNGSKWHIINPNYVRNILNYFKRALSMLATLEDKRDLDDVVYETDEPTDEPIKTVEAPTRPKNKPLKGSQTPQTSPEKKRVSDRVLTAWERIGNSDMTSVIENAHNEYKSKTNKAVFKSDADLHKSARQMMMYLRKRFKSDTYYPNDRIGLGIDSRGAFLKFEGARNKRNYHELIRIK